MHTVSPDYVHNGTTASSWKIFYSEWVQSKNPGKYNTQNVTVEALSAEEAITNAKTLWENFKFVIDSKFYAGKIRHIQALSVFPDGTEFVLWRSI